MSTTTLMPVVIVDWKPLNRNTLRGFAKIRLGALIINDVAVHRYDADKAWASMPAKPIVRSDQTVKVNDQGKIQYVPMIEWADKAAADRFSASVIDALERKHPDATR